MSDSLNRLKRQVLQEQLDDLSEEYITAHRQLQRALDDTHKLRIQRTIKDLEQRIRKVEAELAEIPDVNQVTAATTGTASGTTCLPWWIVLCVVAVIGGAALLTGGKSDDPPAAVEADALVSTAGPDRTSSDHLTSDPVPSAVLIGPDQAVRDYYQLVNERRYEQAWSALSSYFQTDFSNDSYEDYVTWWDTVEYAEVGSVTVLSRSDMEAVILADLWYHMKDGRTVKDLRPNIKLGYDVTADRWLFQDKW